MDVRVPEVRGLSREQVVCMHHLSKQLPSFTNLPSYVADNEVWCVCVCVWGGGGGGGEGGT